MVCLLLNEDVGTGLGCRYRFGIGFDLPYFFLLQIPNCQHFWVTVGIHTLGVSVFEWGL